MVEVAGDEPALVAWMRETAETLLEAADLADAELSVLLCDDDTIQDLNRRWRDQDQPTDVLSFPQDAGPGPGPRLLGDVVISWQTAARQAQGLAHGLHDELRVLLTHGLCHLRGFTHDDPRAASRMAAEESRLLAALGSGPGLVDRVTASTREP